MYFNLLLQVRVMRHKVEEARSNLEATKHRGDVLDGLMTMKKNGKIPGILGRLVSMFIYITFINTFHDGRYKYISIHLQ